MKRHMNAANAVRQRLGRGFFIRGPKVTADMTIPYKFTRNDSLEEHDTDDEPAPSISAPNKGGRAAKLRRLSRTCRTSANASGVVTFQTNTTTNAAHSECEHAAYTLGSTTSRRETDEERVAQGLLNRSAAREIRFSGSARQHTPVIGAAADGNNGSVSREAPAPPHVSNCDDGPNVTSVLQLQHERSGRLIERNTADECFPEPDGDCSHQQVCDERSQSEQRNTTSTSFEAVVSPAVAEDTDVSSAGDGSETGDDQHESTQFRAGGSRSVLSAGDVEEAGDVADCQNVFNMSDVRAFPGEFDEDVSRIPGFFHWLRNSQNWVDLQQNHGLKYTVMDGILRNIRAPCKNWKTVVDNIVKSSRMNESLQTYSICPEHVCFASLAGGSEVLSCPVCGQLRPQENENGKSVTYIPLLPRIARILQNENKCKEFYAYRNEHVHEDGMMSDFFDSPAYTELTSAYGGEESCKYDVFITVSTDGFQVYKNRRCDVWPLVAVLMNLPPSQRYAAKNVVPLMFIPGPSEPKDIQSFLVPLVNELMENFESDGTKICFYDGVERNVRIHLVWFTTDLAALRKCASLTGVRGKTPCRFCLIQGFYVATSRGYYFPSWLLKDDDVNNRLSLFNIRRLPARSSSSVNEAIEKLCNATSQSERHIIARETGIQGRSVLCELSSVNEFFSFPPDIMHLFYNVQRLLLKHLLGSVEALSLEDDVIKGLDEELVSFGSGISSQTAPSPRALSDWSNWKAAEHKHFSISYCLILFDGVLRPDLMKGLAYFVELVDISFRYTVTSLDIEEAGALAIKFVEHYEAKYMMHLESRANFCTYVVHLLLHLAEAMAKGGPLVCCSQYWMEKYIGWISHRLNARKLAAESFLRSAVFTESCKALFGTPFYDDERDTIHQETVRAGGYVLSANAAKKRSSQRIMRLISGYLRRKYDGMNADKAKALSQQVLSIHTWKKVKFVSGAGTETASVFSQQRDTRPSHYVAVEMECTGSKSDVYYGRLLEIISFTIAPAAGEDEETCPWSREHYVVVLDWARNLCKGDQRQVFKHGARMNAFSTATMEDISILKRLIGVVEHVVTRNRPTSGESTQSLRRRGGIRTYFVDGMCREHHLLEPSRIASDGINRALKGF